jgi:hypothetical protein
MRLVSSYRSNPHLPRVTSSLVLLVAWTGIVMLVLRAFESPSAIDGLVSTLFYYTTQSNILVAVLMAIAFTRLRHTKLFASFAFIAFFDISVTAIVFHALIGPYMASVGIMQHVLHTFTPLLYVLWYLFDFKDTPSLKSSMTALIHPLIFMVFVFAVVVPFFSDLMIRTSDGFAGAEYLYPFLNPANYQSGVTGMVLFNVLVLAPAFVIWALGLQRIKTKCEPA